MQLQTTEELMALPPTQLGYSDKRPATRAVPISGGVLPHGPWGPPSPPSQPSCTMAVALWRRKEGQGFLPPVLDCEKTPKMRDLWDLSNIAGDPGLRLTEVNLIGHSADRVFAP
jgi:hypothetical protein